MTSREGVKSNFELPPFCLGSFPCQPMRECLYEPVTAGTPGYIFDEEVLYVDFAY